MSKIIKKNGYWIPTENEWYKAAYYDSTLNNGSGGYWKYATRSNSIPTPITANTVGDGSAGNSGNFANFDSNTNWNNKNGNITTVGSNGRSSYYGTYDQNGNALELYDKPILISTFLGIPFTKYGFQGGHSFSSSSQFIGSDSTYEDRTVSLAKSGFRVCCDINFLNLPNFVSVGDIGNPNNINGIGQVNYFFNIGTYEVTVAEYTEFLNAVAQTDTYTLYVPSEIIGPSPAPHMSEYIIRSGSINNYIYSARNNMNNKPMTGLSWYHCARYCNWLTNGKSIGLQNSNTTEAGAYRLNGQVGGYPISRQTKIRRRIANNNNDGILYKFSVRS
jgi:formylglycine-generating enzyme required for sulfatase activity